MITSWHDPASPAARPGCQARPRRIAARDEHQPGILIIHPGGLGKCTGTIPGNQKSEMEPEVP
eukprot:758841-Hanusia_phi.AAC.2